MPQVKIPPPYRGPTQGEGRVRVEGANVGECLGALIERYPGLGDLLWGPDHSVHRFVTLFVNGEEIDRTALHTPVSEGDEVEILSAVAGG